jgi:hypothetical protein
MESSPQRIKVALFQQSIDLGREVQEIPRIEQERRKGKYNNN